MQSRSLNVVCAAILAGGLVAMTDASAAIVVTEVDPYGSNGSDGYSEDWFELTNTGTSSISISGWAMIDQHASSAGTSTLTPYSGTISGSTSAAPLTLANGQSSLAAGQSAIFLESNSAATSSASATIIANFEKAWFGTTVPVGLTVGTYNDNGSYGLSQTNDMVNIFNAASSSATLEASVAFGSDSGSPIATFDNAADLNNAVIAQKSVVGVNGAFLSASGLEIGSPGVVPLPASLVLMLSGMGVLSIFSVGKKRNGSTLA